MSGDDDDIIHGCHGNTNDPSLLGQLNEEDEVKVHVLVDIEEGELSSGEEGEIKDFSGEVSASPAQQSSSSPISSTVTPRHLPDPVSTAEDEDTSDEEESEKKEEEEEEEEKGRSEKEISNKKEVEKQGVVRSNRGMSICRHFLQGKCSWGRECRFSHDERALSRPHPPLRSDASDQFVGYHGPHETNFMRLPPPPLLPLGGGLPHLPPPPPPPPPPSLPPGGRGFSPYTERGGTVSQVEEESDGWYRLRTIANDWSSDNESSEKSTKKKRRSERVEKKKQKVKGESSESSSEERKGKKERERESSASGKASKRRRQDSSSSTSSDEDQKYSHHSRNMSFSGGAPERYLLHHHHHHPYPPFGSHRPLPFFPLEQRPISMGGGGVPPYHPPFPHNWSSNHLQHSHHHIRHRDHSISPKRRRRQRRRSSSSPSPHSSPVRQDRKRGGKHESRNKRSDDKNINRKEQLLQELSEIDKVIERKKKKKSSKKSD